MLKIAHRLNIVIDYDNLSRSARKPVFGVSNQVGHKQTCTVTEAGFKKKRNCTIHVAKTKGLISFAVTAKLICAFVFA